MAGRLAPGQTIRHRLQPGQRAYIVPAAGEVTINGVRAGVRDGAAVADEAELAITADAEAELVMVETR